MQNFRAAGAPLPDPRASGGWGLRPQTAPPLRISGYAPGRDSGLISAPGQHSLRRNVAAMASR